jgi:hypothetical protein
MRAADDHRYAKRPDLRAEIERAALDCTPTMLAASGGAAIAR